MCLSAAARSLVAVPLLALVACDTSATGGTGGTPSAAISAKSMDTVADDMTARRVRQLLEAELMRDAGAVHEQDLAARRVEIRRAAARALARVRKDVARPMLLRLLSDEDPQVITWAAYGLGDHCAKQREANVSALAVAAVRLTMPAGISGVGNQETSATAVPTASATASSRALPTPRTTASAVGQDTSTSASVSAPSAAPNPHSTLHLRAPVAAVLRAIGRCGATRSEEILVGWARRRGPHVGTAIEALGDVARRNKTLREDTVVLLLQLAAGDALHAPLPSALYPLGRSERLPASTIERARDIANKRLQDGQSFRAYAARTLGRCGEEATATLLKVLKNRDSYDATTRAEAARGLARMGERGQRALGEAVKALTPQEVNEASLVKADFGVLLLTLQLLTRTREARPALEKMVAMVPPAGATQALLTRLSWLRCASAQLLVERHFTDIRIRRCDLSVSAQAKDPIVASIGARAVVAAIGVDGAKLRGARLAAWTQYAQGGDIRARQAALQLLNHHDEVRTAPAVLAKALAATDAGVVAAAAEVLTKHPQRAFKRGRRKDVVDEAVSTALLEALDSAGANADVEALSMVIDAAAALSLGAALPAIQRHCTSPYDTLIQHADKALARLSGAGTRCTSKRDKPPAAAEFSALATSPLWLRFDTSVGALGMRLDPRFAPLAVTRVKQLVAAGYYDNMLVHRVVAGFVSQFGSPTGDGYGGAPGRPPLPCETSPMGYGALHVGVAIAGRDTGSSQLFVTHATYPHLDGGYSLLGTASGAWDTLVDGDRIVKATVVTADE